MKKKTLALRNYPKGIFGIPTIDQIPQKDIKRQVSALRIVLNVKVKNGEVTDPSRLENAAKDIADIIERGGTPVLWGHIGRIGKTDLIDLDSADGKIVIDCLRNILKNRYGYDLTYVEGVIDKNGIHLEKMPSMAPNKAYLLNNIRVCSGYETPEFAEIMGKLFKNIGAKNYFCGAFADLASEGPETHRKFLDQFKNKAFASSIIDEMKKMENISGVKVIQFAGSKLDKASILLNLTKVMARGGIVYVGSAIAAYLLHTEEGHCVLKQLETSFHILRENEAPEPGKFNLAIPEVLKVDHVYVKGTPVSVTYPDITKESTDWIIKKLISTLGSSDKMLLNGTPGFLEACLHKDSSASEFIKNTEAIIKALCEQVRGGASITAVGGDGPASLKTYHTFGNQLETFLKTGIVNFFTGGKVPLVYATEGIDGLPMIRALQLANSGD